MVIARNYFNSTKESFDFFTEQAGQILLTELHQHFRDCHCYFNKSNRSLVKSGKVPLMPRMG